MDYPFTNCETSQRHYSPGMDPEVSNGFVTTLLLPLSSASDAGHYLLYLTPAIIPGWPARDPPCNSDLSGN